MVKRYDDVTPGQEAAQAGRQASYDSAQRWLKDPERMAWLREQMDSLPDHPPPALTAEQVADQAIRQASHDYVQRCLQDPAYMSWLTDQIAVIDAAPPAPRLQPGQLLEQVEKRLADDIDLIAVTNR